MGNGVSSPCHHRLLTPLLVLLLVVLLLQPTLPVHALRAHTPSITPDVIVCDVR
jgi:hypothetical protein